MCASNSVLRYPTFLTHDLIQFGGLITSSVSISGHILSKPQIPKTPGSVDTLDECCFRMDSSSSSLPPLSLTTYQMLGPHPCHSWLPSLHLASHLIDTIMVGFHFQPRRDNLLLCCYGPSGWLSRLLADHAYSTPPQQSQKDHLHLERISLSDMLCYSNFRSTRMRATGSRCLHHQKEKQSIFTSWHYYKPVSGQVLKDMLTLHSHSSFKEKSSVI